MRTPDSAKSGMYLVVTPCSVAVPETCCYGPAAQKYLLST